MELLYCWLLEGSLTSLCFICLLFFPLAPSSGAFYIPIRLHFSPLPLSPSSTISDWILFSILPSFHQDQHSFIHISCSLLLPCPTLISLEGGLGYSAQTGTEHNWQGTHWSKPPSSSTISRLWKQTPSPCYDGTFLFPTKTNPQLDPMIAIIQSWKGGKEKKSHRNYEREGREKEQFNLNAGRETKAKWYGQSLCVRGC